MGKARKAVEALFAVLEARVGAAQALTSEAYALACEIEFGLDDVDTEVLLERLNAANVHLGAMLCAMVDDLDDWGDASAARLGEVAVRYRPKVRLRGDDPGSYLASLIHVATRRARRAHRLLARFDRNPDSKIVRSLWSAWCHLEVAKRVLAATPSGDATVDVALDEHRKVVRERRRPWGDGAGAAV